MLQAHNKTSTIAYGQKTGEFLLTINNYLLILYLFFTNMQFKKVACYIHT